MSKVKTIKKKSLSDMSVDDVMKLTWSDEKKKDRYTCERIDYRRKVRQKRPVFPDFREIRIHPDPNLYWESVNR